MNTFKNIVPTFDLEQDAQTELLLDSKHPGINDRSYKERREHFFNISKEARLAGKPPPSFEYFENEHRIWQIIFRKLNPLHDKFASKIYLEGKNTLNLPQDTIPQLADLSPRLQKLNGMSLVSAEGLIGTKSFYWYLANKTFPCTQFLRHGKVPEFTPEPDMIHDVLGHVPNLLNKDLVAVFSILGERAFCADQDLLIKLGRNYWFAVEFSLIHEDSKLKVLGSGILSSIGEMEYSLSSAVEKHRFVIEEVVDTDYDPTQMQNKLFVLDSIEHLRSEVERYFKK